MPTPTKKKDDAPAPRAADAKPEPKALDPEPVPEPIGPPPIHPQSTEAAHHLRVGYENQVNAEAEAFAARARHAYIDAKLAGKEISLTVE